MCRPFEAQLGREHGIVDETDRVARCRTRVAAEQSADLAFGGAAIDRSLRMLDPRAESSAWTNLLATKEVRP